MDSTAKADRDAVYEAACTGALEALAELPTERVKLLEQYQGIVGVMARWDMERRRAEKRQREGLPA